MVEGEGLWLPDLKDRQHTSTLTSVHSLHQACCSARKNSQTAHDMKLVSDSQCVCSIGFPIFTAGSLPPEMQGSSEAREVCRSSTPGPITSVLVRV